MSSSGSDYVAPTAGEERLTQPEVTAYWRAVTSERVAVWQATKKYVYALGMHHLQHMATDNVQQWQTERASRGLGQRAGDPCEVRVLSGDLWTHAADLTREFGQIFAVTTPVSVKVPGNYVWRGNREPEADFARRSNSSCFLPRSKTLYPSKMADLLYAKSGRLPLHTSDLRVVMRGPERLRTMGEYKQNPDVHPCAGYEWLADQDMFPVYELPATMDPEQLSVSALALAQLRTAVQGKARYLLLQDFGCNYPASRPRYNPWHLADEYRRLLQSDEFDGAFSVVAVVTSPRFYDGFYRAWKPMFVEQEEAREYHHVPDEGWGHEGDDNRDNHDNHADEEQAEVQAEVQAETEDKAMGAVATEMDASNELANESK